MAKTIVEQFREIQPKFSRLYTRMLAQSGLTQQQYAVLLELLQAAPKPMPMTAISCKLYITKPAVTNLADKLEKNGYLKRINHPHDRRVSLLQLQPSGRKVAEKVRAGFLGVMMKAVRQISPKERKTVQRFYSVLSTSVDHSLHTPKRGCA